MAPAHPSDLLHSFPLLMQGGTMSPLRGHFSNPMPSSWEPGTGPTTRQPRSNMLRAFQTCLHGYKMNARLRARG